MQNKFKKVKDVCSSSFQGVNTVEEARSFIFDLIDGLVSSCGGETDDKKLSNEALENKQCFRAILCLFSFMSLKEYDDLGQMQDDLVGYVIPSRNGNSRMEKRYFDTARTFWAEFAGFDYGQMCPRVYQADCYGWRAPFPADCKPSEALRLKVSSKLKENMPECSTLPAVTISANSLQPVYDQNLADFIDTTNEFISSTRSCLEAFEDEDFCKAEWDEIMKMMEE